RGKMLAEGSTMDKVTEATSELENNLGDIGWLKSAEDKTSIPKTVIAVVSALTFFVVMYVTVGPGLLCNLVGFVYPAYASFKAIETEEKEDDTQWLTYWVVFATFNLVETFVDVILFWFPFYYSLKFGFLIWLFLPNVRGAQYLYTHVILPLFVSQEKRIAEQLDRLTSPDGDEEEEEDDDDDDDDDSFSKKRR
ncbi:Receptor expression-enhancing protein 5, partial [Durusdinium trenchii]